MARLFLSDIILGSLLSWMPFASAWQQGTPSIVPPHSVPRAVFPPMCKGSQHHAKHPYWYQAKPMGFFFID